MGLMERDMARARQWLVLVRFKDEPEAGFGKQYVTATNAYELRCLPQYGVEASIVIAKSSNSLQKH